MDIHVRKTEEHNGIGRGEIMGGEEDGSPVAVINMHTAPLVLVLDEGGNVAARGRLPYLETIRVLRTVADNMERDWRAAHPGQEPKWESP